MSTRQEVELITTQAAWSGLFLQITASVLVLVESILLQAIVYVPTCYIMTSTITRPFTIYVEQTDSPFYVYEALLNIPPPHAVDNPWFYKTPVDAICAAGVFCLQRD